MQHGRAQGESVFTPDFEVAAYPIDEACRAALERFRHDCSAFLKEVAKLLGRLKLADQGDANAIVLFLRGEPNYERLGKGPLAAWRAGAAADEGRLVIAGTVNPKGHGHLAVVVKSAEPWPLGYWGSLAPRVRMRGPEPRPLTETWKARDLNNKVEFFALRAPIAATRAAG